MSTQPASDATAPPDPTPMTVGELVALLQECDQQALVVMTSHNAAKDVVFVEEVQPGYLNRWKSWAGARFFTSKTAPARLLHSAVCLWPPFDV